MATWTHSAAITIRVPLGTVVRDDPQRSQDEWEAEEDEYAQLDMEQRRKLWRERRWVHYPTYEDDNTGRSAFAPNT